MPQLVADTSGLVSLGIAAGSDPDPLALCIDVYDVLSPAAVVDELEETASFADVHGTVAATVLERDAGLTTMPVSVEGGSPLDRGEHAAVTLANDVDAALFLCDEFNRLGLIHASLVNTRLVTTPSLLAVFNGLDLVSRAEALTILDRIGQARSWATNSYVERARSLFERT